MRNIEQKGITPTNCLEDGVFQDWMAETGILVSSELDPTRWEYTSKSHKTPHLRNRFIDLLTQNPGRIVPKDKTAFDIYQASPKLTELAVYKVLDEAKANIRDPHSLTYLPGMGFGAGIEKFLLTPQTLVLCYSLWRNLGSFVPVDLISRDLYGQERNTTPLIRDAAYNLKAQLSGTAVAIEGGVFGDKSYYRIATPEQITTCNLSNGKNGDGKFPTFLKPKFQRWLGQETDVIAYSSPFPESINVWPLKENVALTENEQTVADLLVKYSGCFVPIGMISEAIFGNNPPTNWPERLRYYSERLKQKSRDPSNLRTVEGIGWALGIKGLSLSELPLQTLFILWKNYDHFVPVHDLTEAIYGSYNPKTVKRLNKTFQFLKEGFSSLDHVIGTNGDRSSLTSYAYILTGRSKLVPETDN